MAFLSQIFGGGTNAAAPIRYTQMQVQTSAQGLPVPLVWGTARISPNLIWYGDFTSKPVSQGKGGKGGGKGGSTYTYSAAVMMGLCEGPLTDMHALYPALYPNPNTFVGEVWRDQAQETTLAKLNLTPFQGTASQAPWSYLTTNHSSQAIAYSSLAYLASPKYSLGYSPNLPNHSFEVFSKFAGSYITTTGGPVFDANPADIIQDFLTNPQYSIGLSLSQIDATGLAAYRSYCAAQGIFLSPVLDTQEQVSQVIDRWASLTNTLIFWSEGMLKFVPLGDGAITNTGINPNVGFVPNLTVQYDLTYDDFLDTGMARSGTGGGSGSPNPPISVTRIDPADAPNHVKIEIKDRANAYNAEPVEWQDQGLVDQFGQIDSPVTQAHEICDLTVAATVAQLIGQRLAYVRNTYAFTLGAEFSLLEPGDIVTLTDPHLGLFKQPVRIKTIDEDDKLRLAAVAEEFPGSLGTAMAPNVQQGAQGGGYNQFADPGNVNPPCVFEPNSALTNGLAQVWLSASGGANWGGCVAMISFDGVNYTAAGYISAPAPQGVTTADFPNYGGANPDTTDTLAIDLTQSNGVLPTDATHADADAYRTLCLLTAAYTTTIPNTGELVDYGTVVQGGSAYAFSLTYCYRGLYGSHIADHPTGSFFTRIELGEQQPPLNAILIYALPTQYIGKTIWLKFLSYNTFGNELQDIASVTAYQYTTTGAGYGSGGAGAPTQPTGLTATGNAGGIACAWNANPPADNVKYYTLTRDSVSTWQGNATAFTDTNVVPGVSHTYTVTASNAAGTSIASAGATAAALPQSQGGRSIIVPNGTSAVTLLSSDTYVGITNNDPGALTINLPSSPATNQEIKLADEGNNAGTYNWTIKSGVTTVATVVASGGGVTLHWTGAVWQQVF